ncbi:MAG TPA: peptidase, partial [Micromonosporaceae bacterium]|nr:peptidase [Micromonosporaceae bacterium]
TAGTYTVSLTVTDNGGATGTTTQTVNVSSGGTLPECTGGDTRALGKNCQRSNRSATAGNYDYLYIYIPAGTSQLRITTSGGAGNCDLYYNASSWATTTAYTHRSANTGNGETLTITSPPSGYNYISLYAVSACSGVTVKTEY